MPQIVGSFAVVCLMAGQIVQELSTPESGGTTTLSTAVMENTTMITESDPTITTESTSATEYIPPPTYSPIEVGSMLSFGVGLWTVSSNLM